MRDAEFSEAQRRTIAHALSLSILEAPSYTLHSYVFDVVQRSPRIAAIILTDDVLRIARAYARQVAVDHPQPDTRAGFEKLALAVDAVMADRLARVTVAVPIGADVCPKCRIRPGVVKEGFGSETFTGICMECAK